MIDKPSGSQIPKIPESKIVLRDFSLCPSLKAKTLAGAVVSNNHLKTDQLWSSKLSSFMRGFRTHSPWPCAA
ncbi:MAG: hypothetical protein WA324_23905, partial [Bryobacteraceae bacterium]